MLTEERQQKILDLLEKQGVVKSQELTELLQASESTIRRDLQELENKGLLVRIHGGAKQNQRLSLELNMDEKTAKNVHEKQRIAQLAANEIQDEDIIYLDAGSTTLELIPLLAGKKVTIVTNSVRHATSLVELQIPTIILGGPIKLSTNAVLGATALHQLRQLRFNKAFMGINGLHEEFGFTTPDPEEAAMKRVVFENAEKVFVLADQTKFGNITFIKVAEIKDATILTDSCPHEFTKALSSLTTIKEAKQ